MRAHLAGTPVLETERLTLRAPGPQDWEPARDFLLDDRSSFIRDAAMDEGKAWRSFCHIVGMWALRGFGSFAFCLKGTDDVIGLTGPWQPADWPEQELGWTVWTAAAEGRGYAFEAASAARAYAYSDLGWTTAVSYIDPANVRSIALAERLGARLDANAAHPFGDDACLVYRHPGPEAPS